MTLVVSLGPVASTCDRDQPISGMSKHRDGELASLRARGALIAVGVVRWMVLQRELNERGPLALYLEVGSAI